jgi:gluconate 2-dehydrogenase gamma chain
VEHDGITRRDFVATLGSLGSLWLLADPRERMAAVEHAQGQATAAQHRFLFLTAEQAADVDAIASRIIPSDGTPGAHEAGVVFFVDKSLTTWAKPQQSAVSDGLKKLAEDVAAKYPGQARFAALTTAQQDEMLKSMEQTPFFGAMRFVTIAGTLSLPEYGGNKNWVGWTLVGEPPVADYHPPFSWYDRAENRKALLGGDA